MWEIVLVTIIVVTLTPFIWWYLLINKYKSLDGVPGPKPSPIFGNAKDVGSTTVGLLNSFMDLQKRYGTFYKLWLGPKLNLMVTKPEYVEYFTSSNVHLSKSDGYDLFKPWLGDGLLVSTGGKWKSRRKMITPTFHFKVLEKFVDVFNTQTNILLDNLEKEVEHNGASIEMHNLVNMCSLDIICETAFGTPINAQSKGNPKYVEAVTNFLEIFTLRFFSSWMANEFLFRFSSQYRRYKEYLKILHEFTNKVIKTRKEALEKRKRNLNRNDDGIKVKAALLDMLLEYSESGEYLSDEDIREEVDTFMFEGHDTASTAICFTLLAISENQKIQDKVYEELVETLGPNSRDDVTYSQLNDLKYLDIVIKESMRLYSPVPLIARSLDGDCILDGITIPKDTTINIFLYGMNHNPDIFPEPEKFDPERFLPENQAKRHNFAYVPFSAGPRNCIGQKYVVLELKAIIAKIMKHFEIKPVPNFKPEIGMCSVLKSRNGIRMQLQRRK